MSSLPENFLFLGNGNLKLTVNSSKREGRRTAGHEASEAVSGFNSGPGGRWLTILNALFTQLRKCVIVLFQVTYENLKIVPTTDFPL